MKNSFFYKLYLFDKKLFLFILIFSAFTILCNIKGEEVTPFFIWAMYSEKETAINKYDIFRITVNDTTVIDYTAGFTDNNRFFLTAPLKYFDRIKKNNFNDPSLSFIRQKLGQHYLAIEPLAKQVFDYKDSYEDFTEWYARYLQQSIKLTVNKLEVDV